MFVPSSVAIQANTDAWVATDDWNYVPGETVQISAGGFAAGEAVRVQVIDTSGIAENYAGHEPWNVSADANGAFATSWYVAPDALGQELLLTADGLTSGLHAERTFVDANPAAD